MCNNLELEDELQLVSMSLPLPSQSPPVTLTFDLQNLIRSLVGVNKYSAQVSSRLSKPRMGKCGGRTAQKHNAFLCQ